MQEVRTLAGPETPKLMVDVVIPSEAGVVLIRRGSEPFEGKWALPGGFVDVGETVREAAVREVAEETGLAVEVSRLVGVYSEPDRDPRGHNVSVAFLARVLGGQMQASSDAAEVEVLDPNAVELAFDHSRPVSSCLLKCLQAEPKRADWLTGAGSGRLTFRYQLSGWRARASMRPASTRRSSRSETTSTSRPGRMKSCAPAASTLGTASGPEVMAPGSATAATQARSQSSFCFSGWPYSVAQSCRISARYEAMGRPSARNSSPKGVGSTSIFAGAGHVGMCKRSTGSSSNVR